MAWQCILEQLQRYGGEPESELIDILDALTDINDDLNHDRTLEQSLERLYKEVDRLKLIFRNKNFWYQFEPGTKHDFTGIFGGDKRRFEVFVAQDNGRRLYFKMTPEEFESQMNAEDGAGRFIGKRVTVTALIDKHCVRGILTSVSPVCVPGTETT